MATNAQIIPSGIPSPIQERRVFRCHHCNLVQYETRNHECRRCFYKEMVAESLPVLDEPVISSTPVENIGHRIRELRRCRFKNSKDFSSRMGRYVSRSWLSRIENGWASPSTEALISIAEALGVPMSALMIASESMDAAIYDPFLAEVVRTLSRVPSKSFHTILVFTDSVAKQRIKENTRQ